jgi:2-polyprenyl-3-methyl-5-hydroxy-6-metoxy-1,4-benzoquinol methylase
MADHEVELTFETIRCNVCGSTSSEPLFAGPDRLHGNAGTFSLVRCNDCGVIRQNPRLTWDSLKTFYPDDDYVAYREWMEESDGKLSEKIRGYGVWKWLRSIERWKPGGRMLDIGCGTGAFLREAKRSGRWQLEGLEPNHYAAEFVGRRLGIPIHNSTFLETILPQEFYDVITMWNVLEHLQSPVDSIRYVRRLLKNSGWFVFSIPNVDGLDARVAKKYWVGWDLPRHLYLFPRHQLRQILAENGFIVREERCLSTTYSAIGHSLSFWANDPSRRYTNLTGMIVRLYKNPLARLALIPPYWLMDQMRLSSVITIFAERDNTNEESTPPDP